MMNVPFLDLTKSNSQLAPQILPMWEKILNSAHFVGGSYVEAFEQEFSQACDAKYCITVGNGTDALRLAILAQDPPEGGEIITVAHTFAATSEAIVQAGCIPKFIDVDQRTKNLDPNLLKAALTSKTVGIIPVHLYGQCADMDPIVDFAKSHGLWVIEDAAQAHLATYKDRKAGSLGISAAFSFYPGKNLGACGEAGAVTTNDEQIAKKVKMLRDHGQVKKYHHDLIGYNGRCDALQAAALTVKLQNLTAWTELRRAHAAQYRENLADFTAIELPQELDFSPSVFHLFVVQCEQRDLLLQELPKHGVHVGMHYPIPLHKQPAFEKFGGRSLPVTEQAAKTLLSLPMYPELQPEAIQYVCQKVREVLKK